MSDLTQASRELFRRAPDERFESVESLVEHCRELRRGSEDRWHCPQRLRPTVSDGGLLLSVENDGPFSLNDWSFSQLCRLGGVAKDTVNRLTPETAGRVFTETLPMSHKPMQVMTQGTGVRSIHSAAYTRLWNVDLLNLIREFGTDFQPPQTAFNGATGLYCGEQDLFCFLIDPQGWIEIGGEAFAPGFFVWNSEVGRRSVGISTFWFQKVCQNHIVWDATDVVEFTRKHTGKVQDSLLEIRRHIELLVTRRDERKDSFATVVRKAMQEHVADTSEEVAKFLSKQNLSRDMVERAVKQLGQEGKAFTLWNLVDALTHLNVSLRFAGDRSDADQKVAQLLELAV